MTITKASSIDTDLKQYKLADVALRNGKDGNEVWVVIKDNVYDVTHYMDSHPGGTQLILEFAGKDCTKDFYDAGHSLDSLRDHTYLIIGELVFVSLVKCKYF